MILRANNGRLSDDGGVEEESRVSEVRPLRISQRIYNSFDPLDEQLINYGSLFGSSHESSVNTSIESNSLSESASVDELSGEPPVVNVVARERADTEELSEDSDVESLGYTDEQSKKGSSFEGNIMPQAQLANERRSGSCCVS